MNAPAPDALLDEISARPGEVAAALATLENVRGGIQKVRYTHEAMIDLILSNPAISQNELAAFFGYTAGWVSQVINSDMFQAKLAERRDEIVNPQLRFTIEERFRALTARSLDVLQEKLSKPTDSIPDNLALRAAELGAKALGVGGNAPPAPPSTDHLAGLADRLLALQGRARGVYRDLQIVEEVPVVLRTGNGDGSRGRQGIEVPSAADEVESGACGKADGGA